MIKAAWPNQPRWDTNIRLRWVWLGTEFMHELSRAESRARWSALARDDSNDTRDVVDLSMIERTICMCSILNDLSVLFLVNAIIISCYATLPTSELCCNFTKGWLLTTKRQPMSQVTDTKTVEPV